MHLEGEEIFPYIKNRPPIFMLDRMEIEPGVCAENRKYLSKDEWFFRCHFPGNPLVPGVLQLEALFQTAIMAVKTIPGNEYKTSNITKIKDVSFLHSILPDSEMVVKTRLIKKYRHGIAEAEGEIICKGQVCCEASFVLTIPEDMVFLKKE